MIWIAYAFYQTLFGKTRGDWMWTLSNFNLAEFLNWKYWWPFCIRNNLPAPMNVPKPFMSNTLLTWTEVSLWSFFSGYLLVGVMSPSVSYRCKIVLPHMRRWVPLCPFIICYSCDEARFCNDCEIPLQPNVNKTKDNFAPHAKICICNRVMWYNEGFCEILPLKL